MLRYNKEAGRSTSSSLGSYRGKSTCLFSLSEVGSDGSLLRLRSDGWALRVLACNTWAPPRQVLAARLECVYVLRVSGEREEKSKEEL